MLTINEIFSRLFVVGADVLGTFVDAATNVITAQTGDSTSESADAKQSEWWQQVGLVSRAAPPTQGGSSCQALGIRRNDRNLIFATRDTRGAKICGNLKAGETCVYAAAGAARTLWKANGHVVDFTNTENDATGATGQSVAVDLGPDGWSVSTPWGGIVINAQGITITAGQAALTLSASGDAKLVGQTALVSGSLAAIAGQVMTTVGNVTAAQATTNGALYAPGSPTPVPGIPSKTVLIGS